jgi:menaquinone-dependent protoporphyrinogen oxidase
LRILVTWASKRGGTAGIGRTLAEELANHGFEVVARPTHETGSLDAIDAVIVGSALYGNRWLRPARRFVNRRIARLRDVPVWFFSRVVLVSAASNNRARSTE